MVLDDVENVGVLRLSDSITRSTGCTYMFVACSAQLRTDHDNTLQYHAALAETLQRHRPYVGVSKPDCAGDDDGQSPGIIVNAGCATKHDYVCAPVRRDRYQIKAPGH